MEFNNPASRLHGLLLGLSQANPNLPTSIVLATAFGVAQNPKELMRAIVGFHELVREVKEYAAKTNLPTGPLARYIPQIESAVGFTNLDASWATYQSRITKECLVVLEMIAHIDDAVQDREIPIDELKALEASLQELFEDVEEEKNLDREFKLFVLSQIEKIRRAISEYRISGAVGFGRYLETLLVDAAKQADVLNRAKQTSPGVFGKLKSAVKTVAGFASCASDGLKAIEHIKGAIGTGLALLPDFGSDAATGSDLPEVRPDSEITIA